jgi:Na+(H+)/acetate symporter ActP
MLSSLPDILIAIVVILVLSASMSTLSSLVIASSSTLTIDLLKGNIVKKMTEKKEVLLIRIFVVVFIAISALIAIYQTQSQNESVKFIAQLMGVSWGALAGAFLAPFLYGLYWKKTTKLSCWISFVFGAGIMLLNLFFRSAFPVILQSPINCGAFAMLAGLIIVPIVSLISPKPDKKLVEESFACYEKRVPAAQKRSLD